MPRPIRVLVKSPTTIEGHTFEPGNYPAEEIGRRDVNSPDGFAPSVFTIDLPSGMPARITDQIGSGEFEIVG